MKSKGLFFLMWLKAKLGSRIKKKKVSNIRQIRLELTLHPLKQLLSDNTQRETLHIMPTGINVDNTHTQKKKF